MTRDWYESAGGKWVPVPPISRALVEKAGPPGMVLHKWPDGTLRTDPPPELTGER
jgi:hypothetical protein